MESKGSDKKDRKLQGCVFAPDLLKELAEEGAKLREAVRCARRVFNLNAAIRNNRFVMLDSGFSYTVKDIPEYIKKEMYKVDNQHHNSKIFPRQLYRYIRPMN